MNIPEVGDTYSWIPSPFINNRPDMETAGVFGEVCRVHGHVIQVNLEHGWFRAEADFPGGKIRECFKF